LVALVKAAIMSAADFVPVYGDFPEPAEDRGSEITDLVATGIRPG
jgi:hypothetical protein